MIVVVTMKDGHTVYRLRRSQLDALVRRKPGEKGTGLKVEVVSMRDDPVVWEPRVLRFVNGSSIASVAEDRGEFGPEVIPREERNLPEPAPAAKPQPDAVGA